MIQAYMNRYATERRLGHPATDEDIARIHNGGLNGYRKPSTLKFWRKVQDNYERGIDDEDYEYYSSGSGDEIW